MEENNYKPFAEPIDGCSCDGCQQARQRKQQYAIKQSSGSKYIRSITSCLNASTIEVDVYSVLEAFAVTNPAIAHAVKKLLCAGIRGKGDLQQDLKESIDAIQRAIQIEAIKSK